MKKKMSKKQARLPYGCLNFDEDIGCIQCLTIMMNNFMGMPSNSGSVKNTDWLLIVN